MELLREWLFHNWGLKLLALLISFLLWTTYTGEPPAEVAYMVPLEFHNIPAELEISGDVPTQVRVRVRGRPALLRRLTPADLGVSVDLTGSSPGETVIQFKAEQVEAPLGAKVVLIAPSEIRVQLLPRQAVR